MRAYNHIWQINKHQFKEIAEPIGIFDDYFHLFKNGIEYRMPLGFIVLYVPTNTYFIQINKVNRYLERVK